MLIKTTQLGCCKFPSLVGDAVANELFAQAEDFDDTTWAKIYQVLRVPIWDEVRPVSPDLLEVLC